MRIFVLIYIAISFLFSGLAATVHIWNWPEMRRHGRSRFWNPTLGDALLYGFAAFVAWPYILLAMWMDKEKP